MIIEQLHIKNFGNLSDRRIRLEGGLNLITGSNESGKTTLHFFIRSMLYGLQRKRGRAAANDDYSRCEPWEHKEEYGGTMHFEIDGKRFRISRDFRKKTAQAELVCETDGEQLSVGKGDLRMLLGGVSQAVFDNTLCIGQLKSRTDEELTRALRNYVTNYSGSGAGGVSVDDAVGQLKSRRREMERQIREERQEADIRIRELATRLEYLQQERRQLEGQLRESRQAEKPYPEEQKDWKFPAAAVIAAAALLLIIAGIFLRLHPWVLVPALLGTLALAAIFSCSAYRRRKREAVLKEQDDRRQWEAEQAAEILREKTEEADALEKEIQEAEEAYQAVHPLEEDVRAVSLAVRTIEDLAGSQQKTIGGTLRSRTEEILSELTDGKYRRLYFTEQMKIGVDAGGMVTAPERLSRGTIEQIYFAFRMASGDILCHEEKLPMLLDDVFVMYDDVRLARTLRWLSECGHQVLLFTCHTREQRLMNEMGIPYHRIDLDGNGKNRSVF